MGLQPEMSLMKEAKVAQAPAGRGVVRTDFTFCLLLVTTPPIALTSQLHCIF